jgi:hypothetical protein
MGISLLYFGIQNTAKLEQSIITNIPVRLTKNSKAFDSNDLKCVFSFLGLSTIETRDPLRICRVGLLRNPKS